MMRRVRLLGLMIFLAQLALALPDPEERYDPLREAVGFITNSVLLNCEGGTHDRNLPLRIYLPVATNAAAVVIFSHGLGGSRECNNYLGAHWSMRGYIAVFLQHPGSDCGVWEGKRGEEARKALAKASTDVRNFSLRAQDVSIVLDRLAHWNTETGHILFDRLDLTRIAMSGHSFGAHTTQAVSGQNFPVLGQKFTDRRIKAAIMLSPGAPKNWPAQRAFNAVDIPWLLMTGTRDASPISDTTPESRLQVFEALPAGSKYQVVLHDGAHSAFSDKKLPWESVAHNPNHHRVVKALTTAFLDAFLREEAQARQWIDGTGPTSVLAPSDIWQKK